MIKIQNLQKSYNDMKVLEDISVNINKSDIYGLVGLSGAGKSTLLRCINGLEKYNSGSLQVDGIEVKSVYKYRLREFRKNIGMIFQHFSLLERKTVYDNIALPMECWKYSKSDINKKVMELLELVELKDKANSKPKELSGGQKQRIAIARALTMNPKILLCDEATSALDPSITNSILNLLKKINKEMGITIVVVTHQMNVVKQVCNKMAILRKGKLEVEGKVEDIFLDNPKALEELLGETNSDIIPSTGVNIEIINRDNTKKNDILSKLAIETKVEHSIVWGQVDKYRGNVLGSFIINVSDDKAEEVINYLEKVNVDYRRV